MSGDQSFSFSRLSLLSVHRSISRSVGRFLLHSHLRLEFGVCDAAVHKLRYTWTNVSDRRQYYSALAEIDTHDGIAYLHTNNQKTEKYRNTTQVYILSNDSFSIQQKVLDKQIELHIGAIQSRARIRFIHESIEQTNEEEQRTTKIHSAISGLFLSHRSLLSD